MDEIRQSLSGVQDSRSTMTKSKVALCMIVKGSEKPEILERCLSSVAKFVDRVFISVTTSDEGIMAVGDKFGAVVDLCPYQFHREVKEEEAAWLKENLSIETHVKAGDKIFQFDAARNHNFSLVPKDYDWILWLDVDDVLRGGDKLKDVVDIAEKGNPAAESVFFNYIYQAEIVNGEIRNILIQHLRERLIRNNGAYKWIAPIHETLIEQRPTVKIETKSCDVLHLSQMERMQEAIQRNIKTLEVSIYDNKAQDPRPTYYLGKAYFDLRTEEYFKIAEKLFYIYLNGTKEYDYKNKSGWAEERAQCWEYLAEIYRYQQKHNNSIKALHNALIEDEKFPSSYLSLAYSYLLKSEFDRSIFWAKLAGNVPEPMTTLVSNPRDLKARFLEVMFHANLNTNKLDEAWAAATKGLELFPGEPEMKKRVDLTENLRNQREMTRMVINMANYLQKTGENHKIKPLLVSLPADIANNPFMIDLHKKVYPPRVWGENEIAIYCGPGFTPWSPKKLTDPQGTFMGGSEEAVVYLSQELAKKGWKVSVYADPAGDEGEYDGVRYYPYYKFNSQDEFNILVAWRNPKFVDGNYKAKRIYIWCHDVQNNLDYTPERIAKIHKVIFLSHAQREQAPGVPEEKCFYSNNGIPE